MRQQYNTQYVCTNGQVESQRCLMGSNVLGQGKMVDVSWLHHTCWRHGVAWSEPGHLGYQNWGHFVPYRARRRLVCINTVLQALLTRAAMDKRIEQLEIPPLYQDGPALSLQNINSHTLFFFLFFSWLWSLSFIRNGKQQFLGFLPTCLSAMTIPSE